MADETEYPEEIRYKYAGVSEIFTVGWRAAAGEIRRPRAWYDVDDVTRPLLGNGWYYKCTQAGETGALPPIFRPGVGEVTQDGSVEWTAIAPSTAGLPIIATSAWTVDEGVTVVDDTQFDDYETHIELDGGVPGEQYRVTNTITRSDGSEGEETFVLEILDPADV